MSSTTEKTVSLPTITANDIDLAITKVSLPIPTITANGMDFAIVKFKNERYWDEKPSRHSRKIKATEWRAPKLDMAKLSPFYYAPPIAQ